MPLNRLDRNPPGSWRYEERDPSGAVLRKFHNAGPIQNAAKELLDYRTANSRPRATFAECVADIDEFTCKRLGGDPAWCSGPGAKKNPITQPPSPRHVLPGSPARRAVEGVANAVAGASTLFDWLGEGGQPVPLPLAQSRANTCLACPHNKPAHGIARLTGPIARAIHGQREERRKLGRVVVGEEKLQTCAICACHLALKVDVGIEHIVSHASNETLKQLPAWCWQVKEATALTAQPA
jgi:hypothetical protein